MKIIRTGIENFTRCKRCFWLDAVKKIKPPFGPLFILNLAVDHLLKNEFDAWIEPSLLEINELFKSQVPPAATKDCTQ